jgi:hypothetical protein
MDEETKSFWNAVKRFMSVDGLRKVETIYPELKKEIEDLIRKKEKRIEMMGKKEEEEEKE